jgi:hypothetical protein
MATAARLGDGDRPRLARPARGTDASRPAFDIARLTDNELVLFDHRRQESWIVYPPRSKYDFLRRPSPETVIVEHHPWAPYSAVTQHAVVAREGCAEHRLDCGAHAATRAGVDAGWDPFK